MITLGVASRRLDRNGPPNIKDEKIARTGGRSLADEPAPSAQRSAHPSASVLKGFKAKEANFSRVSQINNRTNMLFHFSIH